MNAFQIVEALSASFFGLIGIWAAVVRRHWFLRFIVACGFLLSTVLITAHEVAIEFGIQIALIMLGVWIARNRGNWQFQFSIETALLLKVVVSIVSAVIGSAGKISWWSWHFIVSTGICAAGYALTGLWLTYGKARLKYRIALTLLSIGVLLAFYHFAEGTRFAIAAYVNDTGWMERFAQHYEMANVFDWFYRNAPSVLLGAVLICSALLTGRYTGWFSDLIDQQPKARSPVTTTLARLGFVTVLLTITCPLVFVFYRLMTPTQVPVVELKTPNGYDDFITAGKSLDDDVYKLRQGWQTISRSEWQDRLDLIEEPLQKIVHALRQPHFQISPHSQVSDEELSAFDRAAAVLLLEYCHNYRFGEKNEKVEWALRTLRLGNSISNQWDIMWPEELVENEVRALMSQLNIEECRHLIKKFSEYEAARKPMDDYLTLCRSKIENSGWEKHLNALLSEWSGKDPYGRDRWEYRMQQLNLRTLITQLALQAHYLDQQSLPDKLDKLVPAYLDTLPLDPFTEQPIEYANYWGGYALTSSSVPNLGYSYIHTGPAAPLLWHRLQETWQGLKEFCQGFLERLPTTDRR